MQSEDVLVLLKIAAIESCEWTPAQLSYELGHTVAEIEASLKRLTDKKLLRSTFRPDPDLFKKFLLMELPKLFPVKPGKLTRGILTGAKQAPYFTTGLPYTSIWVWPSENGKDWGFEIAPLSPHTCFAAFNDRKLRQLLAIAETLRVAGQEARLWAEFSLRQIGLF
ncbi:MAG: hypothetical protein V4598_00655 [Bdellovibrionota bacterium]